MMYDAYQALADAGDRVRMLSASARRILEAWSGTPLASPLARMAAYYEVVALAGFTHERPDLRIDEHRGSRRTASGDAEQCRRARRSAIAAFSKEGGEDDPKVLLVAPMSGHFATLLRGTLRTMLRDHQVYITDWINPRNVKLEAGRFGLEDYTSISSISSAISARIAMSSRSASRPFRRSPRPPSWRWTAPIFSRRA